MTFDAQRAIRVIQTLALCAAVAVTAVFIYVAMFTVFAWYDDEGYIMLSVKTFLAGQPLYDQTFSQYGPFYYLFKKAVFAAIGAPVSHDLTRLTTVVEWMAVAALISAFIYRVTKSLNWAIAAYLQTVYQCWRLVGEPGHPQELLVCLLAAMALAAAMWPGRAVGMALLGMLTACMVFTKINVGTYAAVSLTVAFLALCRPAGVTRAAMLLAGLAAALLPFAIMRPHLAAGVMNYAGVVSLTVAACVVFLLGPSQATPLTRREIVWAGAGLASTAAAIMLTIFLMGTSPTALIDAMLIRPMRFSSVYFTAFPVPPSALRSGAVSLALAAVFAYLQRARWMSGPVLGAIHVGLKLAFGVAGAHAMIVEPDDVDIFVWVVPFIWIALLPEEPRAFKTTFPRVVLCLLAALQLLVAYPVAGNQRAWATLLLVPILVLCLHDAASYLFSTAARPIRLVARVALLAAIVYWYYPSFEPPRFLATYRGQKSLGLTGAHRIRLPNDQVGLYQWLTFTVQKHCDAFVTMPGYNSLHFWTGIEPVTGYNATAWMTLLDDQQQQRIVDRLSAQPRACVIYHRNGIGAWVPPDQVPDRPLVRYMRDSFRSVTTASGYELMIRNDRVWQAADARMLTEERQFRTVADALPVPSGTFFGQPVASLLLSFRTTNPGGLLGCQSEAFPSPGTEWIPLMYVNNAGRISGQFYAGRVQTLTTTAPVNDGQWHRAALVRGGGRQTFFVDGREVGSMAWPGSDLRMSHCQLGVVFTGAWPDGTGGWMPFDGHVDQFKVVEQALSPAEIEADFQASRR